MTTIPNQHEAPYETLDWVREGTAVLLAQLDRLSDDEFGAASLLPGWRRTHVLAHLSRDADALGNLLTWAATGVPTPMYSSFEQRNLDIEAGAIQSAAWLREDLRRSCDRVTWQLDTMPAHAWHAHVRTLLGNEVPAARVPWLRTRELWVHLIDLNTNTTTAVLPDRLVDALLEEACSIIGGKLDCPAVLLRPTDRETTWSLTSLPATVTATGRAHALLAWLIGRSDARDLQITGTTTSPPSLPAWL
ncbi:maleylpyruvate isomerase family mycothiol-dependent enzyme [Streptomyces sp. NBC_01643]|uniref:maleylpyruvate isomerase family mycothiol-dependent enzyme n=1 Tax=Streptomyces sp. NBC_01643 TaxID=2975906 RepID=UPI00386BFEDB|nr:maleylpyruvate isomerase family mycothiol-dependent enzyme [Streptomyces sp. NBC_01643]